MKSILVGDEKSEQTQKPDIFLSKNASQAGQNFQIVSAYNDEDEIIDQMDQVRFNSMLLQKPAKNLSQSELELTVIMLQREN